MVDAGENNFWIQNWAHESQVLKCDGYGVVTTTTTQFPVPLDALWRLEKVEGKQGVLIQAVSQKGYLALSRDGTKVRAVPYDPNALCFWGFEPANRNTFRVVTNPAAQDRVQSSESSHLAKITCPSHDQTNGRPNELKKFCRIHVKSGGFHPSIISLLPTPRPDQHRISTKRPSPQFL